MQFLLDRGSEVVVLSRGMLPALQICPETIQMLRSLGIEFHLKETKQAVERYNRLAGEGKAVGGLFHSTC